jgi:hypothetical protein
VGTGVGSSWVAVAACRRMQERRQDRRRGQLARTGMVSWWPYNAEGVPIPTAEHSVYGICNRS